MVLLKILVRGNWKEVNHLIRSIILIGAEKGLLPLTDDLAFPRRERFRLILSTPCILFRGLMIGIDGLDRS
jgi:hypothetical protein